MKVAFVDSQKRQHGVQPVLRALVASLPAAHAQPADLQEWARLEWHIENRLHWVRDVTFHEDAHRARTGNGQSNIARATRRANRRPHDLITTVTSAHPTTQ